MRDLPTGRLRRPVAFPAFSFRCRFIAAPVAAVKNSSGLFAQRRGVPAALQRARETSAIHALV